LEESCTLIRNNVALKGKTTTVEYLPSNQVVGGSNLSGRAIIINDLQRP